MVNADLRAAELIKRTVGIQYPSVAEIGVFSGDMSRRILYRTNLHLLMVDSWGNEISESYKESKDPMASLTEQEWQEVMDDALKSVSWASDRVRIYHGTSSGAAEHFDEKFDIVFIDADHSYDGAITDMRKWWPKVTAGGYLGGHDYGRKEFGVTEAVVDFADAISMDVELGSNYTWWIKKSADRIRADRD